jgi:hypothetical protein
MHDTNVYVIGILKTVLAGVCYGNWHAISVLEVPPYAGRPQTSDWRRHMVSITISLFPLAVLVLARSTGLALPDGVAPYATLVAYLWAIVGVIGAFDPLLRDRLGFVRDALQLVRGAKEEK